MIRKSTIGKFSAALAVLACASTAFAQTPTSTTVTVAVCPRPIMPDAYITLPLPPEAAKPPCIVRNTTCSKAETDKYLAEKAVADKARADRIAVIKGEADAYFNSLILAIRALPDYATCEQDRILNFYNPPAAAAAPAAPARAGG